MVKKRIGILVIYNENGIIEEYVGYLLKSLKDFLSHLIVVVNGYLLDEEINRIRTLADEFLFRENVGYDGGAYKEVLLKLLSDDRLSQFDELVLCNDSFYGPLLQWEYIFETMSGENTDFWGFSKWSEGPSDMPGYPYLPEHVQAYFLVVTNHMFRSEYFIRFWEEMKIPYSYDEAIRNFEIAFTTYFCSCGFRYKTWLDISGGNRYLEPGRVVYCSHMADLIENCQFPVIKRKSVSLPEFEQYLRALKYVRTLGKYKSEFLEDGWKRYERKEFPYVGLKEFYNWHEKIYVFGYGKWGRALESYFGYKGWKIEGFVVSESNKTDKHLFSMNDLHLDGRVGIVVALGEKNGKEMVPILRKKVQKEHLLVPTGLSLF